MAARTCSLVTLPSNKKSYGISETERFVAQPCLCSEAASFWSEVVVVRIVMTSLPLGSAFQRCPVDWFFAVQFDHSRIFPCDLFFIAFRVQDVHHAFIVDSFEDVCPRRATVRSLIVKRGFLMTVSVAVTVRS